MRIEERSRRSIASRGDAELGVDVSEVGLHGPW